MPDPENNATDLARPSTSKSKCVSPAQALIDAALTVRALGWGDSARQAAALEKLRRATDAYVDVRKVGTAPNAMPDPVPVGCRPPVSAEHYSLHKLQLRDDPEVVRSFRTALGKWVVTSENGRSEMRTFEEMGDAWRYVGPDTDGADEAEAKPFKRGDRVKALWLENDEKSYRAATVVGIISGVLLNVEFDCRRGHVITQSINEITMLPPGCRPPPEFAGETWHWVYDGIVFWPLEWNQKNECWALGTREGMREVVFPTDERAALWTWHSVAFPTPKVEPAPVVSPPRCEPPDEFKGHILHWVLNSRLGQLTQMAAAWSGYGERWSFYGRNDDKTPEQMAEEGWTYDKPVEYPTAVESTPTLSQALLPCPICGGVEGCDHTVPERLQATLDKMVPAAEPTLKAIRHFVAERGWNASEDGPMVRFLCAGLAHFRPQTHYVSDADKSLMRRVMTGAGCAHVWHRVKQAFGA